ncbi:MAG TPA: hypothetical protein VD931_14560 [Baekduia sp.]|nr:hypothetical protein [Baekduia sp.]
MRSLSGSHAVAVACAAALVTIGGAAAAEAQPLVEGKPLAKELEVTVATGSDDLAAGSNAVLVSELTDGGTVRTSLNEGRALPGGSSRRITVALGRHVLTSEIQRLRIEFTPAGSDVWQLDRAAVSARSVTGARTIVSTGSSLRTMSASSPSVVLPFTGHTVAARPARVDLRPYQTAYKSQGGRYTCGTFSTAAAIEAAYKRQGYGDLDLSEEFLGWTSKMFWLSDPSKVPTAAATENQVGAFAGGNGARFLNSLQNNVRAPLEGTMPYHAAEYSERDHPHLAKAWNDPLFASQKAVSDVNLSALFPDAAREAPAYYGISSADMLLDPDNVAEIESILASNREVVLDLDGLRHSVLVVGYDRTDPSAPVVYLKDSGGFYAADRAVAYREIVEKNPSAASFVGSAHAPFAWPKLAFLGRWNLSYDGWRGVLDIYHLPGVASQQLRDIGVAQDDLRIGTFYDHNDKAHRVNGRMTDTGIEFYFDTTTPNLPYDKLSGRHFRYSLMKTSSGYVMSGSHVDPDGRTWGGYARRGAPIVAGAPLATPLSVSSYLGARFAASWRGAEGTLRLGTTSSPHPTNSAMSVIRGTFETAGSSKAVDLLVERADAGKVSLADAGTASNWTSARKLSWDRGTLAGQGLVLVKSA